MKDTLQVKKVNIFRRRINSGYVNAMQWAYEAHYF